MKKMFLMIALSLCAMGAFATPGNNGEGNGGCGVGQTTNGCGGTTTPISATGGNASAQAGAVGIGVGYGGTGGAGGQGGAGGDARAYGGAGGSVLGSGNSSNRNENTNQQGQRQTANGGNQSQSNAATGYGGTGGNAANNGSNVSIDVAAPVIPKPAANTAYVGDLPQLPQGSCRLFIGGGGTTRDGSATGMIPIGNDQTCLSTRALEVMKQINASVGSTVFGKDDMLDVACKIEGMNALAACKK